ncbi:29db2ef8-18f8-4056-a00c-f6c2c7ba4e67 [Thermothielavioides terrestris]|uniref:dual-specificity kinase n=2 Tax=Thermothielavioides terrestris TaxID=2587410 RepID=G2RB53_THETT|nr:uncharacterized protein THITE_2119005 [Thermothielavioides terrestris NRRL 8126]AEO69024.1 hypothetical protein THITE_2119005 [Thermothielavioides terrestris NRRL 8126]SPQ22698.1 29db2ef8-18f8-4056-a00c-f6c2c7ba4e67 [Thermothielavioides terrestris]
MSTPTTATATLPHYSPHTHHLRYSHHPHHPHHSHPHQQPSYPQPNSSSYRPPHPILPPASRLAYPSPGHSSAASLVSANGVAAVAGDHTTRLVPPESDHRYTAMPPAVDVQARPLAEPQPPRKRRRSREPDWNAFYKNGLPKEVIVIDDTPEPERPSGPTGSSQTLVGSGSAQQTAPNSAPGSSAKKRKRDDEPTPYDPVRHSAAVGSHTPSKSTAASDRTNSAIHTTAATSLGSLSSNGQYEYETQAAQKRKRTTRQQIANEARRREAAIVSDALAHYRPPPYPPKKARDVHIKVIQDPPHSKNVRVDDDDGHYIVVPDNDLTDRYQMIKLLGQGTFGKVVQARDKLSNKLVAIKIIRSVQKYREASKIELRVLETLRANDEENRNRCIHLRDCFDYRGHICIVMDLLGQSVFDFLKSNSFVPFPNSQIQSFARQLFTSVAFLHDLNLIHTDLKPENILLCNNEYQTFTYNRKIPSSSTTNPRTASQRKVLLDTEIRLIDFGSATFQDEYHSAVVSTRHYRAPEIILGLGWSFPCDIWSIGCILVEFFTGDALFQTHDNLEHLAMMEAVIDAKIDVNLVHQVNRMTRNGGNPASKYFKRLKLDYPTPETTRASRRFVKAMKRLPEIVPPTTKFLAQFLDLLQKIFVYDPAQRITAKQALQHPWFREVAHPDDGTEAARIRAEKLRARERERELGLSAASHGPVVEERAMRR